MSNNFKSYAMFNLLTITGRISHVELAKGKYGEFLAVTLLSELQDDAEAVSVQFNTTDSGLVSLFNGGHLNTGRRMTIAGHLKSFTELYFDKKAGKTKRLQRPRLVMDKVSLMPGGMGPGRKVEDQQTRSIEDDLELDGPTVDPTPALTSADYE